MENSTSTDLNDRMPWITMIWSQIDKKRWSLNKASWLIELTNWIVSGKCFDSNNELTWKEEVDVKETPFKIEIYVNVSKRAS